jgi:hypothetical protein
MTMLMENRRRVPRANRRLPVHLIDSDGDFSVFSGETLDIGPGGLRVLLAKPLGPASDVIAQVDLPGGGQVISNARIADFVARDDGYAYRLIFLDLAEDDASTLLWLALPTGW